MSTIGNRVVEGLPGVLIQDMRHMVNRSLHRLSGCGRRGG